jgi:DNA repair exonuclease SbcCD ATPase subunit
MNIQSARERLSHKLADVSEVATGVLRGVRRNGQRDVAAYVFDLNNRVPETIGGLSDYLDDVMGPAYFNRDASPDLRWNSYLYFVVDERRANHPEFQIVKRNLEADKSYARKFVVAEADFDRVLSELDSVAAVDDSAGTTDVVKAWSDALGPAGLADTLDGDRPVADVVRSISSGTAKQSTRTKKSTGIEASQKLVDTHLSSIDLTGFRPYPKRHSFDGFGKANLVFGSNGVGKTSLLEGLEFLYCGANRRSGIVGSAVVQGLLASGHPVKTSSLQALSDFKTRQRIWYGADDNSRQNRLPNQFARFNFLNTDAAAELTLLKEDSTVSNAESLAALLSGHEATLMWRRIQDVRKAVAEEVRSKRSERAVAESDRKAKDQERQVLEAAPAQSDAAFSIFKKDLERIEWRDAPASKQDISEELVDSLSDVVSQLSIVQKLDWLSAPVSPDAIMQAASKLRSATDGLQAKLTEARNDEQQRSVLTKRQENAKSRLIALQAIPASAYSELKELFSKLRQADDELAKHAQALASLPTATPPEGWESTWGNTPVTTAVTASRTKLANVSQQLDATQRQLSVTTRTQSELQSAMTELHAWAQKVVAHRHSDTNCPVCGTEFSPGELLGRMHSLILASADASASDLRLRIEQLSSDKTRASIEATWLAQIDKFTRANTEDISPQTVSGAQLYISNLIAKQHLLLEASAEARDGLNAYARLGWSLAAIEKLCAPIEGDERPNSESLDPSTAQLRIQKFLNRLQVSIDELENRIAQRNEDLRRRLIAAGFPVIDSATDAIELLITRQKIAMNAAKVCEMIRGRMNLSPTADLHWLSASLEAAVLGAKKVLAAVQNDSESTTRLASLQTQVTQLTERLGRVRDSIERLTGALQVLDNIIEKQSLDIASAAVVAATHTVADSIFKRIHAPNEYMVTADAQTPLRRRDNNSTVQLNQVSTGQRAAYALSLFLAMNAQVKTGPKVILLDDPISHIDDLNALSFLDYLRNLVLKSDRQVFFATADEKIAGLFAHKFGFLDDEFKTIELTRA